jgi:hypothetical protein
MPNFPERVAERAADIRVARILLTLLAVPFYVLGFIVGVVWVGLRWAFAAVAIGVTDVSRRRVSDDAG